MIEKTLDDYNYMTKTVDLNTSNFLGSVKGNRDMVADCTNCYQIAYANENYLFNCNHDAGRAVVRAIYNCLPKNRAVIYLLYTNTFRKTQLNRMVQDLWCFNKEKQAKKFYQEMKDQEKLVKHSHLIKLPLHPQLNAGDWSGQFVDPFYEKDKLNVSFGKMKRYNFRH